MRRSRSRLRWVLAGGAVAALLLLAAGLALTASLRSAAEAVLSELVGVPVRIDAAHLGWPPGRLALRGVRIGAGAPVSLERLTLEAPPLPLLRGELRDLRLELRSPRIRADAPPGGPTTPVQLLRRLVGASFEGRLAARVDVGATDIATTAGDLSLAPFVLRQVELRRSHDGPLRIEAEVATSGGTGRVSAEIGSRDGDPTLSVEADLSGASLAEIVRSPRWQATGTVHGRLGHRRSWSASAPENVVTADVAVTALDLSRTSGHLTMASLRLEDVRVDLDRLELVVGRIEASSGAASPDVFDGGADGDAADPTHGGIRDRRSSGGDDVFDGAADPTHRPWVVRITRADLADLRVDTTPPLTLASLRLRDIATPQNTGAIELDARLGDTRVRFTATRREADRPGEATLAVDAFPLALLTADTTSPLKVPAGLLDLRLELSGPPGIQGAGQASVRRVVADVSTATGERRLFEVADLIADLRYFSLDPLRLRVRSAQIVEPRVWVRGGEGGFEIAALLAADASPPAPSRARAALARVEQWAGPSPTPETLPGPVDVRISDGEIVFVDETVEPSRTVTLADLDARVGGPAGPAGPVEVEVRATSQSVGAVRLRGRTGPEETNVSGEIGPVRLPEFNVYSKDALGFSASRGTVDLSFNARLEPAPAMNVRIGLDGIVLAGAGGDDPLSQWLGEPLPRAIARIQGDQGHGRLDLSLQGRADRPAYGLLEALPEALRRAAAGTSPP